jgi:putative addiction module killer protein
MGGIRFRSGWTGYRMFASASPCFAVLRRIDRLAAGNPGDHRFCRAGVWELRVDLGPGFRAYYATVGTELLLLLGGGSKRTQQTDIENAIARWKDYRSRR